MESAVRQSDRRMAREILVIILIKLFALFVLWWCCVREARLPVDAGRAAERLAPVALTDGRSARSGDTRAH